ncbi:hypothetical protein [Leptolyngbya ohadii]|uniref:hypothetical protein n=1 Tax=Leptolyngbya ohadii TaxID=1962290 RepID=UPI000B59A422|nr:hypothetical protein [Leptolyngbya ohadii]
MTQAITPSKVTPIKPQTEQSLHKTYKRPILDILADLAKPIPRRFIGQLEKKDRRTGKVAYLDYVPWYHVAKLLDFYAPGWEGEITHIQVMGDRIVLTYALTIHAQEGDFVRTATGQELLDCGSYGDPSSNAESMAFRRAAAKFGLGLDLYDKD